MPIYEYQCEKCEEEFEVSQRITEDALTEHDDCGGEVKRLISRTSFSLKGKGWYSDHYGLKPGEKKKKDGDTAGSKPDGKTETKTEAKSESKSESSKPADKPAKTEKKKDKPAS